MSRDGLAKSLEEIICKHQENKILADHEIEWLIEHCTDFMNELNNIENAVRYVFGEEPVK